MEKYIPTVITLDDDSINRLADALASRIGAVPQWKQARAVPPVARPRDRRTEILERYGDVVTIASAAKMLGRARSTVRQMLEDGRLTWACEGTRVDVSSIADYIERPGTKDAEASLRRRRAKAGKECRFRV